MSYNDSRLVDAIISRDYYGTHKLPCPKILADTQGSLAEIYPIITQIIISTNDNGKALLAT